MTYFVGVDLGGTNIRAARYDAQANLLARSQMLTLAHEGQESVVARILACIREVLPGNLDEVRAIAVGAPGPLNPKSGIIVAPPNLPLYDFQLKGAVQDAIGRPTFIGNDANLAGLAEWKFGAARGYDDVLYLTISTGIGSGIISNGRMLVGKDGLAAEAGHLVVVPEGPVCGCGQRGHLEAVAGGPAIARWARGRMRAGAKSIMLDLLNGKLEDLTAVTIGQAAERGDALAIEILAEAGNWIGRAVADLLHILNSGVVVVGGGVSNTGEFLLGPIRQAIQRYCMSPAYWQGVPVVRAHLGAEVGLLGALALAIEETRDDRVEAGATAVI